MALMLKSLLLPSFDAQHAEAYALVLSKRIPLLYAVVLVNSVLLGHAFLHSAPLWMVTVVPSLLAIVALYRMRYWWRLPDHSTPEQRLKAVVDLGRTGPAVSAFYML